MKVIPNSMKNRKKVIAFVMAQGGLPVPATKGGAIETLMSMLMQENEKQGRYEFVFVCNTAEGEKAERVEYQHATCIYLPKRNKKRLELTGAAWIIRDRLTKLSPGLFYDTTAYYKEAMQALKAYKPEFIICEEGLDLEQSVFRRIVDKKHLVVHKHHTVTAQPISGRIFGKAIMISDYVAKQWNAGKVLADKDVHVLKNAIIMDNFDKRISQQERKKLRASLGFDEDDFVVLFCGRIVEVKGLEPLINAVLATNDRKIKLLIIGSSDFAKGNFGAYAEKIKNMVDANLSRIVHIGYVPNEELYSYYQSADIQVIPSLWEEAAGLVAIEGAISGLPLIITKSGGMVEYVDSRYTEIVEKDDRLTENLCSKFEYLKSNPQRCQEMSRGNYEYAKQFNEQRYYDDFDSIIESWNKK